jgi:hypothetical protein
MEVLGRATTKPTKHGSAELDCASSSSVLTFTLWSTLVGEEDATPEGPAGEEIPDVEGPGSITATGSTGRVNPAGRFKACTGLFKSILGLKPVHAMLT